MQNDEVMEILEDRFYYYQKAIRNNIRMFKISNTLPFDDIYSEFIYQVISCMEKGKFKDLNHERVLKYLNAIATRIVPWYHYTEWTKKNRQHKINIDAYRQRIKEYKINKDKNKNAAYIVQELNNTFNESGGYLQKVWQTYKEVTPDWFEERTQHIKGWFPDKKQFQKYINKIQWKKMGLHIAVAERLGISRQLLNLYRKQINRRYKFILARKEYI